MQQSQTILNYLNGNYLLSTNQDNQIVTIEFDSQFYYQCSNFLNYQLFNHINSSRPLLVIDLECNFRKETNQLKNIYLGTNFEEKNGVTKFANNVYSINKIDNLKYALTLIENEKQKTLEVLYLGIEISESSILNQINEIQNMPFRSQITLLVPKELRIKELKTIFILTSCRLIIESLQEATEKFIQNGKEFHIYDLIVTLILKKANGHSFLKTYIVDGGQLHKKKLKINKIKKELPKNENEIDITKKTAASFNLLLSSEQKQKKAELDDQINPYKNIMSQDNVPLIYQKEGDEKRILIDDEEDDLEEVEEYEG